MTHIPATVDTSTPRVLCDSICTGRAARRQTRRQTRRPAPWVERLVDSLVS